MQIYLELIVVTAATITQLYMLSTFLIEPEGNTALKAPVRFQICMAYIQMPKCT